MNYRVYTPQHRRQRPQVAASAAEGHGDARVNRVAQLDEDDAQLVTAQLRQRHRLVTARQRHGDRAALAQGGKRGQTR